MLLLLWPSPHCTVCLAVIGFKSVKVVNAGEVCWVGSRARVHAKQRNVGWGVGKWGCFLGLRESNNGSPLVRLLCCLPKVGLVDLFGTVAAETLKPGIHLINPLSTVLLLCSLPHGVP